MMNRRAVTRAQFGEISTYKKDALYVQTPPIHIPPFLAFYTPSAAISYSHIILTPYKTPLTSTKMLATLHEWSIEHISDVFEAKSEDECLRAIDHTFSQHIEFMSNGKQLCRADLQKFVLSMVMGSGFRLKVQWQNALEVPRDASNRVCCPVSPIRSLPC